MDSIFPLDVELLIENALAKNKREPDRMLHASSHLENPLRHTLLDVTESPKRKRDIGEEVTLWIGTALHSLLEQSLRGQMVMLEVDMSPYLPDYWTGTADFVLWDSEQGGWVLGDLKSCKSAGLPYIRSRGAKETHIWQTSLYWHALVAAGLPMLERVGVVYLPKDSTPGSNVSIEIAEFTPIESYLVYERCEIIVEEGHHYIAGGVLPDLPEREQKRFKDGTVKLVPYWWENYCDYVECEQCGRGETKIGKYELHESSNSPNGGQPTEVYVPRKGYEGVEVYV